MTLYEAYKKKKFELSMFGIERGTARSDYFCTPIGSKVIGWTGVGGIHYCMVRGFDEMVFCVDPMAGPGDYVHPVAENFHEFVLLLLACRGEATISQAYAWNQEQFQEFLKADQQTDEKRKDMELLQEEYSLVPMEVPYTYIKKLQESFDYRQLRFKKIYYEWAPAEPVAPTAPEWKVYFHGDFFSHEGRERAGQEIRTDKQFLWGELNWQISAVYSCTSGLVIDLCASMDPEMLMKFEDRVIENAEDQERVDMENPLNMDVTFQAEVNGAKLKSCGGCGISWIPQKPGEPEWNRESRWVLEHYGYDLQKAWIIHRIKFEWDEGGKKREVQSLQLKLIREPVAIPGGRFVVGKSGEKVTICHPISGTKYELQVEEIAKERLERTHFRDNNMEYPDCYSKMSYYLVPELPANAYRMMDCVPSDPPRPAPGFQRDGRSFVAAIGIIGGADGPTALVKGGKEDERKLRVACSSLHFEPVEEVQWRISFLEKLSEDTTVQII